MTKPGSRTSRIGDYLRRAVRRAADELDLASHPYRVLVENDATGRHPVASFREWIDARQAVEQLVASGRYDTVYLTDVRPGGKTSKHWRPKPQHD